MRTGKIIFAVLFSLLMGEQAFAQGSSARMEMPGMDKADPTKTVQAFPNPATDYLTLHFEQPQARKIKLTVYTILGNSVEVESEVMDDFEIKVKVRDLNSGYYLLALNNQETSYKNTFKFLKR